MILEVLVPMARTAAEQPILLGVHPDMAARCAAVVAQAAVPVSLLPDETIARGTAILSQHGLETRIDPSQAVAQTIAALNDYFTPHEARLHG